MTITNGDSRLSIGRIVAEKKRKRNNTRHRQQQVAAIQVKNRHYDHDQSRWDALTSVSIDRIYNAWEKEKES
jgi:hypothetical protein